MAKIPFDIKYRPQIESGEYKVETRDGKTVRIICWNAIGPSPIIGLFLTDDGGETTTQNRSDGRWSDDLNYESDYDLFLVTPEPELTEFEKKLSDVVGYAISLSVAEPKKPTSEFVKEYAAELLALARKQLIEEQFTSDPRKTDLYKLGKAEAMKDLPRWRHAFTTCSVGKWRPKRPECPYYSPDDKAFIVLLENSNEAKCLMLDDLKKLPGFKED